MSTHKQPNGKWRVAYRDRGSHGRVSSTARPTPTRFDAEVKRRKPLGPASSPPNSTGPP